MLLTRATSTTAHVTVSRGAGAGARGHRSVRSAGTHCEWVTAKVIHSMHTKKGATGTSDALLAPTRHHRTDRCTLCRQAGAAHPTAPITHPQMVARCVRPQPHAWPRLARAHPATAAARVWGCHRRVHVHVHHHVQHLAVLGALVHGARKIPINRVQRRGDAVHHHEGAVPLQRVQRSARHDHDQAVVAHDVGPVQSDERRRVAGHVRQRGVTIAPTATATATAPRLVTTAHSDTSNDITHTAGALRCH